MIKYAIFDLDGTLLSTLESIRYHLNRTLVSNGLSEITLSQCGEFIGNGARKLVTRAVNAGGGLVAVRRRDKGDMGTMNADEFLQMVLEDVAQKKAF